MLIMKQSQSILHRVGSCQDLYEREGLSFVGVFGSQARNEARDDSDIDVLIDYSITKSLFDLARIQIELEYRLNKQVDLVTRRSLKPALRSNVEQDLITVYGKK